ncbi:MAG: HIT family protein [Patescibacteria group bacterium]
MSTIFSKIIAGEIPGFFVYQDEVCVVIMDKYPAVTGQSMVILRRETPYIFDLTDAEYAHIFSVAKRVAKASDQVLATKRSCLVVEGFEVPHVHIKIYPMPDTATNLGNVMCERVKAHDEDLADYAKKIGALLSN